MRAVLILSLLFVIFGSLYPFNVDLALWSTRNLSSLSESPGFADVIANVALFVPYGFASRMVRRRMLALFAGAAVALLVQIAQDVIPDRSPSLWDFVVNLAGMAIGWFFASLLHGRSLAPKLPVSLFVPAVCYVAYELAPFAPTLDIGLLRVNLKLFAAMPIEAGSVIRNAAQVAVLGTLLALALPPATVRRGLLLILPFIAVARLLIIDNGVSPGALAGLAAGALLIFILPLRAAAIRMLAVVAAAALLLDDAVLPFVWRAEWLWPSPLPFAGLFSGDWLGTLVSVLWKTFLYGSIVEIGRHEMGRAAATLAILVAVVCEAAQIPLASGTPEISDILLAAMLAWLLPGLDRTNHLRPRSRRGIRRIPIR